MAQVNLGHVVGPGVPTGGTANQVLVKNGATNFDTSWKDAGSIPSIENIQDGIAIVANGNTHVAVASGQFVYVKNHGTLSEGMYRATAAIGTNATLSTSNLTADVAGGLNALKGDVDTLNSKISKDWETVTNTWLASAERGDNASATAAYMGDRLVQFTFMTANRVHANDDVIAQIPSGYRPYKQFDLPVFCAGELCDLRFKENGDVVIWTGANSTSGRIYGTGVYIRA